MREFPKAWAETAARTVDLDAAAGEHLVTGLTPTSTYQFRASLVAAEGGAVIGPGPDISADTLAAGCTPKDGDGGKKGGGSGCIVQ